LVAREYVGQPVAFEAIHAIRSEDSLIKIDEITVTERVINSFTTVGELENIRFRVVLLGIQKKSSARFLFNPINSTILETGDVLLVMGNYMFVREFTKFLSKKPT
jgi:voltage-gated potassium channel